MLLHFFTLLCPYISQDIDQEAEHDVPEKKPSDAWPSRGAITFKDVCFRYRDGLPLVLKNLSIQIGSSDKIGIVGRTGAGKTSLISTLMRLTELSEGSIEIDGLDIGEMGLRDLRSAIAVIPQDPTLFQGTVRLKKCNVCAVIFGINVSLNFSGIMLIHSTATLTPPFGVRWKRLTSRRRSAGAAASWRCPWTRRGTTSQSGRSSSSVWPGKAYYDLDEVTIAIFSAIFISEPC